MLTFASASVLSVLLAVTCSLQGFVAVPSEEKCSWFAVEALGSQGAAFQFRGFSAKPHRSQTPDVLAARLKFLSRIRGDPKKRDPFLWLS